MCFYESGHTGHFLWTPTIAKNGLCRVDFSHIHNCKKPWLNKNCPNPHALQLSFNNCAKTVISICAILLLILFGLFPIYGSSLLSDHPRLYKRLHLKEKTQSNETIFYWKHKTGGKTLTCYRMLVGCYGAKFFLLFLNFVCSF